MKKTTLIFAFAICFQLIFAQRGGDNTYDFLNLTSSARVAALGGTNVSISDLDINMAYHNPALLKKEMNNQFVINYVPYVADIRYGYLGYVRHIENVGTFSLGIHNINYGTFNRTGEYNEELGTATAAEYAIGLSYARKLSPDISMAMTIKPIYSVFDVYSSFGLATDFGFHYSKGDSSLSFGIVLRNLGSQVTSYDNIKEKIPTDLQIGISKKLNHAPFRFSLTAQDLLSWNLTYTPVDEENISNSSFDNETVESSFSDNLLRHFVLGIEFLPTKNFHVDFGYNHRKRKELTYTPRLSTVGYSWGFGFKVYKFLFSYGSSKHHLGGSSNHFSLSTNLGR